MRSVGFVGSFGASVIGIERGDLLRMKTFLGLICRQITFLRGLQLGIVVCSLSLFLTVAFDSFMWQRCD